MITERKTVEELLGQTVQLKVCLRRYRWPRKKADILPGHFAIAIFDLKEKLLQYLFTDFP